MDSNPDGSFSIRFTDTIPHDAFFSCNVNGQDTTITSVSFTCELHDLLYETPPNSATNSESFKLSCEILQDSLDVIADLLDQPFTLTDKEKNAIIQAAINQVPFTLQKEGFSLELTNPDSWYCPTWARFNLTLATSNQVNIEETMAPFPNENSILKIYNQLGIGPTEISRHITTMLDPDGIDTYYTFSKTPTTVDAPYLTDFNIHYLTTLSKDAPQSNRIFYVAHFDIPKSYFSNAPDKTLTQIKQEVLTLQAATSTTPSKKDLAQSLIFIRKWEKKNIRQDDYSPESTPLKFDIFPDNAINNLLYYPDTMPRDYTLKDYPPYIVYVESYTPDDDIQITFCWH